MIALSRYRIVLLLFGLLLISISYFTARHDSVALITQYILLFSAYAWLLFQKTDWSFKQLIWLGIGFRILLLLATPNLSEDVFRFIWDGRLWLQGIDAYAYLPNDLIKTNPEVSERLFKLLNSPGYYTIYPPINQLIFVIAASVTSIKGSIIIIRLFILAAEVISLITLSKLIQARNGEAKALMLYALNPLAILELTGNLHFEAFVICFLLLAIHYLDQNKKIKSAIALGLSISFKIIPIIWLAAFFKKINLKAYVFFVLVALAIALVTFLPLLQTSIFQGGGASAKLYFQTFEFNASIYYLVREVGYWSKGYNIIQTAGPLISLIGFALIDLYNLFASEKTSISERALWSWFIYCLFATTIHPWYILPLVVLSSLTDYKFPLLWSFLIFFTYLGYSANGFSENLWITAVEYISVISFAVFEIINRKKSLI